MNQPPLLLHTVRDLRSTISQWRRKGDTLGLVPTMGALHAGHVSLVDIARQRARRCIVTIFVNPAQFAPSEDLAKYPRTLDADLAKVGAAGADAIFAPSAAEMYPTGFCSTVSLQGPAAAALEDRFRPTHFAGVATVVLKLLTQSLPDLAVFGEKDFQQLCVVRQMVRDLDLPVDIIGAPTRREVDGLAMSSRNVNLTPAERAIAPVLNRLLLLCRSQMQAGMPVSEALATAWAEMVMSGLAPDYLELRDAVSLAPVVTLSQNTCRLLVAARLGNVRLIDNIEVKHRGGEA